jgi:hypothetical protein
MIAMYCIKPIPLEVRLFITQSHYVDRLVEVV